MITIYTKKEISAIRESCKIVCRILRRIKEFVEPNVRTLEINKKIAKMIKEEGASPAFLGYRGFPRESCISTNEVVVHGIPGQQKLKQGDLVSIDIGVVKNGFYGDAAITYPVGKIDDEKRRLIGVTEKALYRGIEKAIVDNRISDISAAIEDAVLNENCLPVRELVGHGIGRNLHEEPQVPNFRSRDIGPKIEEGMVIAIEPMINLGTWEVETMEDGWTVVTKDRKPSAHFEHTIAIVNGSPEILTQE